MKWLKNLSNGQVQVGFDYGKLDSRVNESSEGEY